MRDASNQTVVLRPLDCFASLAMTGRGREIGDTLRQFAELPDRCSAGLLVRLRLEAVLMRAMWDKA